MSRLKEFEEFAKHQRHANARETEFWCGQFQLKARQYAEEIDRLTEALQTAMALPPNRFDCPECGPAIAVDEDGCCRTCGADAKPIVAALRTAGEET